MARIIQSMSEFTVILQQIGTDVDRANIDSMRRTRERVDSKLKAVERQVGSLSRVGGPAGHGARRGARLSHTMRSETLTDLIVRAKGPWPIVDNSVSPGRTKPHTIGPDNKRNPRPLPPAKGGIPKPSLEFRGGGFVRGAVSHPGSARRPLWSNFIQSVQPTISKLFGDEWNQALRKAVG